MKIERNNLGRVIINVEHNMRDDEHKRLYESYYNAGGSRSTLMPAYWLTELLLKGLDCVEKEQKKKLDEDNFKERMEKDFMTVTKKDVGL